MSNYSESWRGLRRLVLVRHGETVGQSSIRYYGASDVALSDSGSQQMARVRTALAAEEFDAVYTSERQRTVAAALIIAPHLPAQPVAGFNEINFGRWEGLTRAEIAARDPELFRRWRVAVHEFAYPDGDAVPAFHARVAATLHAWLPTTPARTLLIVHKGVIATVVTELLRLSPAERAVWPIDLASIHTLVATAGEWHAERVNQTDHLDGLP
jgi:broad specificity phosphatase PhoE